MLRVCRGGSLMRNCTYTEQIMFSNTLFTVGWREPQIHQSQMTRFALAVPGTESIYRCTDTVRCRLDEAALLQVHIF